jgi:hypothetical protein
LNRLPARLSTAALAGTITQSDEPFAARGDGYACADRTGHIRREGGGCGDR